LNTGLPAEEIDLQALREAMEDRMQAAKRHRLGGEEDSAEEEGSDGGWVRCSHWEPCPMGLLPGERVPRLQPEAEGGLEENQMRGLGPQPVAGPGSKRRKVAVADDDAQGAAGRASDREWLAPPPIAAGFRDSTGRGAGAATLLSLAAVLK